MLGSKQCSALFDGPLKNRNLVDKERGREGEGREVLAHVHREILAGTIGSAVACFFKGPLFLAGEAQIDHESRLSGFRRSRATIATHHDVARQRTPRMHQAAKLLLHVSSSLVKRRQLGDGSLRPSFSNGFAACPLSMSESSYTGCTSDKG